MSRPPFDLTPTQCAALADLAGHGPLRRCRTSHLRAMSSGYRATSIGYHDIHSPRAIHALVRLGLAEWSAGESELRITTAGLLIARSRVRAVRASSRQ